MPVIYLNSNGNCKKFRFSRTLRLLHKWRIFSWKLFSFRNVSLFRWFSWILQSHNFLQWNMYIWMQIIFAMLTYISDQNILSNQEIAQLIYWLIAFIYWCLIVVGSMLISYSLWVKMILPWYQELMAMAIRELQWFVLSCRNSS